MCLSDKSFRDIRQLDPKNGRWVLVSLLGLALNAICGQIHDEDAFE